MELQIILPLIIGIILFIGGLIATLMGLSYKKIIVFLLIMLSGFFVSLSFFSRGYKDGQIDALKGKQRYEMHIDYHLNQDSVHIPDDTTFILIDTLLPSWDKFVPEKPKRPQIPLVLAPEYQEDFLFEVFLNSLIYVESRNTNAFNPKENAAGYLQIRPIMVREINRLLGYKKYTLDDRWSKSKSIEMFLILQDHYNPDMDFETAARMWNGGRSGLKKKSTLHYWNRVQDKMEEYKEDFLFS